jgi:hypothetical protein
VASLDRSPRIPRATTQSPRNHIGVPGTATAVASAVVRLGLIALVLGGCSFPRSSEGLACVEDTDCDGDRACESGFCTISGRVGQDASNVIDTAPDPDGSATPDADPFEAIKAQCMVAGYTAVTGTTSLFKSVNTNLSWAQAQADCKNDVLGATHLIVMSSQAEVTFMAGEAGWVGLFDNDTNVFQNVTGELNDLRPFDSGQPDDGGGDENCVRMRADNGKLDDDQCDNGHRYVCECDGKPSTP